MSNNLSWKGELITIAETVNQKRLCLVCLPPKWWIFKASNYFINEKRIIEVCSPLSPQNGRLTMSSRLE